MRVIVWQFVPTYLRITLPGLELQLFLMPFPYALQYPEVVQEIQERGDDGA